MKKQEKSNRFRQRISENSIDWLFCVELNACHKFRLWVASHLFPELEVFEHVGAWRSVANEDGETDILWCVKSSKRGHIYALIENKIDASAQKEQYLRYEKRGNDYVEKKDCDEFVVALIAPKKYSSEDAHLYPFHIFYEDIRDWLQQQSDERSGYLASLYQSVIKPKRPTNDEMTTFRQSIWELANAEFPQLGIPDPGPVNKTQNWVEWKPFGAKSRCIFKYKMDGQYKDKPVIDLELTGRGDDVEQLKEDYRRMLAGTGIIIEKTTTGVSAVFRLPVPNIESPNFDKEAVRAALQAAMRLKEWWEEWGDGKITVVESED